jgi:hypothetical protein
MALRIKSHWHAEETERSLDDIASALAFIAWRIATDKAINLHGQDFLYESDEQRLAVIREYLYFCITLADRISYQRLEPEQRRQIFIATVKKTAAHVQDNSLDLLGPGDHGKAFLDQLNQRSTEYAEFQFSLEDGPSYPFMRHLGYEIQQIMGERPENRWVIDQVMDKDGWEAYQQLSKAMENLFD